MKPLPILIIIFALFSITCTSLATHYGIQIQKKKKNKQNPDPKEDTAFKVTLGLSIFFVVGLFVCVGVLLSRKKSSPQKRVQSNTEDSDSPAIRKVKEQIKEQARLFKLYSNSK